jgi:K+-transporting ATPase c subunit
MVEGGLVVMLYVTLTTPGTSEVILAASFRSKANGSLVGEAVTASLLSQQRTSIWNP